MPNMTEAKDAVNVRSLQVKNRKALNISEKLEVLKKYDNGMKVVQIARSMGLPESTVRTIKKNEVKIKECAKNISSSVAGSMIRRRSTLKCKFESLLHSWIVNEREKGNYLSWSTIKSKALSLYDGVKKSTGASERLEGTFSASRGWFSIFEKRHRLKALGKLHESCNEMFDVEESINQSGKSLEVDQDVHVECLIANKSPNQNECNKNTGCLDFEPTTQLNCDIIQHSIASQMHNGGSRDTSDIEFETLTELQQLLKCLNAADELKRLVSAVEKDEDRREGFNNTLDGLMSYYDNVYVKKLKHQNLRYHVN